MTLNVLLYLVSDTSDNEHSHEATEVYTGKIENILTGIAIESSLYDPIWDPSSLGAVQASDLIEHLQKGIDILIKERKYFSYLEPRSKKGTSEDLLQFAKEYLAACKDFPVAKIEVKR